MKPVLDMSTMLCFKAPTTIQENISWPITTFKMDTFSFGKQMSCIFVKLNHGCK